jgi:hypothetical protein
MTCRHSLPTSASMSGPAYPAKASAAAAAATPSATCVPHRFSASMLMRATVQPTVQLLQQCTISVVQGQSGCR